MITSNEWKKSYTREYAAYPLDYVRENKFHYGIANDFEVTKEFFQSVKNKVESKFNK